MSTEISCWKRKTRKNFNGTTCVFLQGFVAYVDLQYLRVGKYMKNIIITGCILLISDKDSTFALLQNKSYTVGFSFKSSIIQLPYSKTLQGFPEEC